jgi:hypothetical protein
MYIMYKKNLAGFCRKMLIFNVDYSSLSNVKGWNKLYGLYIPLNSRDMGRTTGGRIIMQKMHNYG